MAKYKVLTPIKHDGKPHKPGSHIDCDDSQAESLLAARAIEGARDAKKDDKK